MKRWFLPLLVLVFAAAVGLRWPGLAERPLHNDEAVNGVKFRTLWQGGGYRYDPHEYHGPTLAYATLPAAWARMGGDRNAEPDELTLRLVPLAFGLALVLIPLLSLPNQGRAATIAAMGWTAVSPVMVYYSRYYIHELLLVCFGYGFLAAGWRMHQEKSARWVWLTGISLGLLMATKETFVIMFGAMALAAGMTFAWCRWRQDPTPSLRNGIPWGRYALVGLLGLGVAILLFSSFFSNASGPLDAIRTYLPWLNRAGGASPHIRPWHFYMERLLWFHFPRGPIWTEIAVAALALAGMLAALFQRLPNGSNALWLRFLGWYAVILAGAYSVIGYKTPWCALGFWQPMILLAGIGTVSLVQAFRNRVARTAVGALLVAAACHLAYEAWQLSHAYSWRRQNPWVFAHTSADILKLVDRVRELAQLSPEGRGVTVKVMAPDDDYWPLPWYLRDFKNVGYYSSVPPDPMAPIVIASVQFEASLETRPGRSHLMAGLYELRPQPAGVPPTTFELYVRMDLWQAYLKAHPPKPDDE
jgi:uncharacterized protein (TIGR03663 family)